MLELVLELLAHTFSSAEPQHVLDYQQITFTVNVLRNSFFSPELRKEVRLPTGPFRSWRYTEHQHRGRISLYLLWKAKFWLRLYKRTTTCEYSNYPIDLGHTAHVLSQVFNLQNISYTDGPTIPRAKTITLSEWHPAGLFRNTSINTMNKWQAINHTQITLYLLHRLLLERTH